MDRLPKAKKIIIRRDLNNSLDINMVENSPFVKSKVPDKIT